MVAIPLTGKLRFVTVASPGYLATNPAVQVLQDLMQQRCLRQRLPGGKRYHWEFQRGDNYYALDVPGSLTLDSSALMAEAAAGGPGVAYVPEHYARRWLDNRQLVVLPDEWSLCSQGLALYFPQNRHMPLALRMFIDTVKAVLHPVSAV